MSERALALERDGIRFDGVFAAPGPPHAPGILVLHEILGFTPHIRAMPARLAAEGFATLAVDLFARGEGAPPDGSSLEHVQRFARSLPDSRTGADIAAALALLAAQPETDASHLAVVGFSWGGTQALHANAAGLPLAAVVAYYPKPVYPALLPTRPVHAVDRVAAFGAPTQAHFGERDRAIPPDEVERLRAALLARGLPFELYVYEGARHGFAHPAPGRPADLAAAELAWVRMLGFLRRHLA